MYVVFVEGLEGPQDPVHTARTLEQAFAQITCRCGYSYRFEPAQEQGWCLFLIDVERPERSPDPIHSTCIKPRDAHHDLMTQAVDGRLKGHVALHIEAYRRARIMRSGAAAIPCDWKRTAELRHIPAAFLLSVCRATSGQLTGFQTGIEGSHARWTAITDMKFT